jgi:hypothetical protein
MTAEAFRKLALAQSGAVEMAHGGHPDFRAGGKVFASLGYPEAGCGMVKLTPEQQVIFIEQAPEVFQPCKGAWGRGGATSVDLAAARPASVKAAMEAAWTNVTAKPKRK